MDPALLQEVSAYADAIHDEEVALLRRLAAIPSPSHHERLRAAFVSSWLRRSGAREVSIDTQRNVLCLLRGKRHHQTARPRDIVIFAAHTDVVFNDDKPLPVRVEGNKMKAPGIGDDTANLVALLIATRYLLKNPEAYERATRTADILVVANSCEEGLGNLAGTRGVFDHVLLAGRHVRAYHSFDLYLNQCINSAVGSERWRIDVSCQGGHSYHDFGRANAILELCRLIVRLHSIEPPVDPKTGATTTLNVGTIKGGTTVNSIPAHASALFEYRSESSANLACVREQVLQIVREANVFSREGAKEPTGPRDVRATATAIGIRPGNGDIDVERQSALTQHSLDIIESVTGKRPEPTPASTDANIPLSLGIPATTIGAVTGALLHTRDEWVDLDSLRKGLCVVLAMMLTASEEA